MSQYIRVRDKRYDMMTSAELSSEMQCLATMGFRLTSSVILQLLLSIGHGLLVACSFWSSCSFFCLNEGPLYKCS